MNFFYAFISVLSYIKNDRKKSIWISQHEFQKYACKSTVLVFGVATWQQLHVVVYYGYFVSKYTQTFYSELQIACIQYDYNIMPIYL